MKTFTVTVDGITRREYFEACRESARRLYIILAVSMVVICGAIILAKGRVGIGDFLGPAVVYVIVAGGYTLLTRLSYKDQLSVVDPPVEYSFNRGRWTVKNGAETVEIEWNATPKLRRTRSCLFLYNDGASSNLLPLRSMTAEQAEAIESCFENSREAYKAYRKETERAERKQFREDHPGLRLGRTGPAWGPWKRNK